ncbi:MAG: acyl-phosphate glycerol 3-phosphate acyltransferase [Verrucomicrobia bacterium]|nr:MAG: acyl-phosphate glycerol 3-phosphate acyltransferase [Verrucomicrobiota bacterium]
MLTLALVVTGSYLLGSIPFGYLAGRIAGIDIRKFGSGNVGATNVTRTLGKAYGYPVFMADFLKGFGAVKASLLIAARAEPVWSSQEVFGIVAAICAVLGHSFPVWLHFKGGKGVATSAGSLFALAPVAASFGAAVWIVTFAVTRYVSVASVAATASLPVIVLITTWLRQTAGKSLFYSSVCLAAVVIWRHRSNLSRLVRGTEPRFIRK